MTKTDNDNGSVTEMPAHLKIVQFINSDEQTLYLEPPPSLNVWHAWQLNELRPEKSCKGNIFKRSVLYVLSFLSTGPETKGDFVLFSFAFKGQLTFSVR